MTVLGIDTATRVTAVGVVRDGRVLAEVCDFAVTGHAARLPEITQRALDEAGLSIEDLTALAVSVGPGSFTGLRVGLSFAKGIAFSAALPVIGVGTLESLATRAPSGFESIAALLDARRGETYLGLFRAAPGGVRRVSEDLALTPDEASARIADEISESGPSIVLGDACERYPDAFRELGKRAVRLALFTEIHPLGSVVASLGERKLRSGKGAPLEALAPVYVRAPAAERNLARATLTMEKPMS